MDTQLPAGDDDEETVTLEVVAKNKGGKSKAVRVKVKSKAKTFQEDDFEDISQKMNDLKGEGNEKSSLSFGLAVISSAKVTKQLHDGGLELQKTKLILLSIFHIFLRLYVKRNHLFFSEPR